MTQPAVAAFDLDGTLTDGGSVFKWLGAVAGQRRTYQAAAQLAAPLLVGGLMSGRRADDAKERLFGSLLAGRDSAEVTRVSVSFAREHLASHSRALTVARLRWHQRRGDDVVIVSASPEIYVTVVADVLGAAGALGTRLALNAHGQFTGRYEGQNCRGEEKMRRLTEWISERHSGQSVQIWAYGNSRGDRRLLDAAQHPYNLGRLGRFGALRTFPALESGDPTGE